MEQNTENGTSRTRELEILKSLGCAPESPYTCTGDVRGNCGHRHRTLSAAVACVRRDARGCRSQGGYTDRVILDAQGAEVRPAIDVGGGDQHGA